VGLGASIAPLDFAVNIAFPAITQAFALQTASIRWVAVSYVLTYGSLMLGFGALGDRIGYRRVFRAGLMLAAIAFAACALAPTYGWLLAARVAQGVAVALTLSCAPAMATLLFDESRRTWALSTYTAMAAIAGVLAPIAGGLMIAVIDWPGVYWFRVPIALLALAGMRYLSRDEPMRSTRSAQPFDTRGSAMVAASMALLLLAPALLGASTEGVPVWAPWPIALAGVVSMAAFIRRQRNTDRPFMPREVTRNTDFWLINLAAVVVQFASFAVPLITPYFLVGVAGWETPAVGALMAVWAVGSLAGSSSASGVISRLGAPRSALIAMLGIIIGLGAIACWRSTPSIALMAGSLLVHGAGLGLFQVAYTDIVIAALPINARGVAGSLTMVTRTIGLVVGASLWIAVLQSIQTSAQTAGANPSAAFMSAFATVFVAAAVTAGSFVAAWMLHRTRMRRAVKGATL
jgi:MFS family permease